MKHFDETEFAEEYENIFEMEFGNKKLDFHGFYLMGVDEFGTTVLDFKGDHWQDFAQSEKEYEKLEKDFMNALSLELDKRGIKL